MEMVNSVYVLLIKVSSCFVLKVDQDVKIPNEKKNSFALKHYFNLESGEIKNEWV